MNKRQRYVPRVYGNPAAVTETKYFDSVWNNTVPFLNGGWNSSPGAESTTTGTIFYPQPGTAYNQRVGRKVFVKKIRMNIKIIWAPQQAASLIIASAPTIRMILFMDKQANATQPTGDALMLTGGYPVSTFQNPQNFGRFQVLRDKIVSFSNPDISQSATLDRSGMVRTLKLSYKFNKPVVVNYNQTNAGNITDVVDNAFHFFAGSDINLTDMQIQYQVRTIFCDP